MKRRIIVASFVLVALMATTLADASRAQEGAVKVDAAGSPFEVLTRGPVHEAFATQYQTNAVPGVRVDREPPQLVEEIPPAMKPAGDAALWIPGYWGWDADASDFLWVSGTWRNPPPGHQWVPGYWNRMNSSFQWMCGFWMPSDVAQMQYYSAPPRSLERGPNSDAPGINHFWVPGSYVPNNAKYAWQPGYWCPYQTNYLWVPSYNMATGSGYVHVPGYWDYRMDQRGTLFAPVRLNASSRTTASARFTPGIVTPLDALQFHLFSQANSNTYLFGNYYDSKYAGLGIQPWYSTQFVRGVPDPTFGYYNWLYSGSGANYYLNVLTKWNAYYVKNVALRPALTLVDQINLANQQSAAVNLTNSLLAVPLTDVVAKTPTAFVTLTAQQTTNIVASATGLRALSTERLNVEGRAGGPLNVAGAANTSGILSSQTLKLPVVATPVAPLNAVVPAHPSRLINQVPNLGGVTGGNVGGGALPQLPVKLPGL